MGAETTGRKLGIGIRLFAKAARQGVAAAASSSAVGAGCRQPSGRVAAFGTAVAGRRIQAKAGGFVAGAKRFAQAMLGPVAHTGGVLWLEVTGLFFGLFALFFAQNAYKFRQDCAGGPEHAHFWLYASLAALFGGFTVTQFSTARGKEKKRRESRE